MLDKIITYSFYLLFFLTPLFWTSLNYELFEYNKMILTYAFTVIIVGTWLLKMIQEKSLIFKRTPLDIPLLLFLAANVLSTVFSIDPHTSWWGYYSRSNGGLLSLISYLLLYFAYVANFKKENTSNLLKAGLGSGFIISLWAISEHFGISPSCIILRGEFNASCWVQDVQARVFASLGQPNWMAAYLAMLIFPTLYFLLTATKKLSLYTYYSILTTYYLAFTFTYSRGPTLGLIAGMVVFAGLLFFERKREVSLKTIISLKVSSHFVRTILLVLGLFLFINLLFGSALTSFRLVSKFAAPARPGISLPSAPISGTQLENGGTESGQIRFIVWKGALDIFKNFPIFGSGLETFAYSYYQFRPDQHNLTSEWDFLYNKAHNEYLNYLATTGIVGFGTYMLVIGTFIWWSIKLILRYNDIKKKDTSSKYLSILISTLFASYISYLIYNFFLFSVVIIAIFFYLFPALVFVATDSVTSFKLPKKKTSTNKADRDLFADLFTNIPNFLSSVNPMNPHSYIYQRPGYTKLTKAIVIFVTLYLLYSIFQLWYADTLFNQGQRASDLGNPGKSYNLLSLASELNPSEPFYRSELAYSAAAAAAALKETDATLSALLKDEALIQLSTTLKSSPRNTSFWRSAVRTYFALSELDQKYLSNTLDAIDTAIKLAPTDPKLYYNKALILASEGKKDEQIDNLNKALELKPNYLEAKAALEEATKSAKP